MSELIERYEKEKAEKLNPKSKSTKENIIYIICWILFIGSLLFVVYAINQQNGLAITSSNDFYRLVVPIATMFFSFNIINK